MFEGDWRLTKRIADARTGTGVFEGRATFTRQGDALTYLELGVLTPPGTDVGLEAERRYSWREENGWIAISFEDGRAFHAFPQGVVDPEATHLCDPDRYEVEYDFAGWPDWQVVWTVTGPRKDYRMTARYARA